MLEPVDVYENDELNIGEFLGCTGVFVIINKLAHCLSC